MLHILLQSLTMRPNQKRLGIRWSKSGEVDLTDMPIDLEIVLKIFACIISIEVSSRIANDRRVDYRRDVCESVLKKIEMRDLLGH